MKKKPNLHPAPKGCLSLVSTDCSETLYRQYVAQVYQRCLSLTHDCEQAQDLTQDIFLKVLTNCNKFKVCSRRSTWLYTITFNQCIDQLKPNKRWSSLEQAPHSEVAEPEKTENEEDKLNRLTEILNRLLLSDVGLLRMRYEHNLPIKTIARHLALRESAVKMRLMRARSTIADSFLKKD
jgi:RNA polymerase sigma factor (sigma-70 family)